MKDFKVGVLIPDRNDRPDFLFHCWRMLKKQTLQPDHIELVNDAPLSEKCDITYRYRVGYDRMRAKNLDVIAFIENDDWYSPHYLETMVAQWAKAGKPDLFGTIYTIYFNVRIWKYLTMHHQDRASAMNTLIKPDLKINWPVDDEPFTDMHLWINNLHLKKKVWRPEKHLSIGIKHGIGKTGGAMHLTKLYSYDRVGKPDNGFLESVVDTESLNFYKTLKP
jgi:hypothetical protein